MTRSARLPLLVSLWVLVGAGAAAEPAVTRPGFSLRGKSTEGGVAFFVRADTPVGVAAVGTAHTFDLEHLVQTKSVEFRLGRSGALVARPRGFLAEPGRPFFAPGGTLRGDFVVYALEGEPEGIEVLSVESRDQLAERARVRILGIPPGDRRTQDEVYGRVAEVTHARIEVDLDVPYDLRGWGGAPVLSVSSGKVVGLLQASAPRGSTARVSVAPISGVRAALARPLAGGSSRPFAAFAEKVAAATPRPPEPAAEKRRETRTPRETRGRETPSWRRTGPFVKGSADKKTQVSLEIEYPTNGAVVANAACGTFVAGRAMALQGALQHFDVMIVIDTSRSTVDASGADINGNGVIGRPRLDRLGTVFDMGSTDPGDSILAAEVAAAFQLLRSLDPRSTRVGVVTFAGEPDGQGGGIFSRRRPPPAITFVPLTAEYNRVEEALDVILSTEPAGSTHMAAGVDQATIELLGLGGSVSKLDAKSEKLVFFFTDGQATLPYGPGFEAENVRAVLRAANRASRGGVRIHSFAIGLDALNGPIAVVEMAARTDGYFTPVRHPGDLIDVVEEVNFANLREIRLRSITTGEAANPFRASADGTWAGFVKMKPGLNRIEVVAQAEDGTEAKTRIQVSYDPKADDGEIPKQLVVQRNRLLEDCLREIKRVRRAAVEERAEEVRRELLVEIERERARARQRAAEQRKQLDLEIDDDE